MNSNIKIFSHIGLFFLSTPTGACIEYVSCVFLWLARASAASNFCKQYEHPNHIFLVLFVFFIVVICPCTIMIWFWRRLNWSVFVVELWCLFWGKEKSYIRFLRNHSRILQPVFYVLDRRKFVHYISMTCTISIKKKSIRILALIQIVLHVNADI
jgi:hypothetical protein